MTAAARCLFHWGKGLVVLVASALLGFHPADAANVGSKGLPKTIEVELSHTGLAGTKRDSYLITIDGTQARRGVQELPIASITRLIEAIDEPPLPTPTLANLGMTDNWLGLTSRTALAAWYPYYVGPEHLDANQQRYFYAAFADPAVASAWVSEWSSGGLLVTDDYPSADVQLTWADGSSYKMSSESQWVFMVPWAVGSSSGKNYNADISRAIAALLPSDALNRPRLAGDTLEFKYTDWLILFHLRDGLDSIEARDVFGDQLAPIARYFTIKKMQNGLISSDDLNGGLSIVHGQTSVQLRLQDPSQPPNVSVYMSLWTQGNRLNNVPQAVSIAKDYAARVLSVPWLRSYLSQNRDWSAEIRVVQDRSITPQLRDSLLTDLRGHGKTELADALQPLISQTVYLYLNGPERAYSRWFVLPHQRMLLWNYQGAAPLLTTVKTAPTWSWYGATSVGIVFGPNGKPL